MTRDVRWLFAAFETIHFFGLCLLVGSLAIVDLRLLGVLNKGSPKSVLNFTHIAILGFVMNLISGAGCFSSSPSTYWYNPLFRIKLVLILLAGLNVLWFEVVERKKVASLGDAEVAAASTRLVAAASLILWALVICFGRFLPVMAAT